MAENVDSTGFVKLRGFGRFFLARFHGRIPINAEFLLFRVSIVQSTGDESITGLGVQLVLSFDNNLLQVKELSIKIL